MDTVSVGKMIKFWRRMMVMFAQQLNVLRTAHLKIVKIVKFCYVYSTTIKKVIC